MLITEDEPAYGPFTGWTEMIRKVYEVDPLIRPSCGGRMKIISFIEEAKTIQQQSLCIFDETRGCAPAL